MLYWYNRFSSFYWIQIIALSIVVNVDNYIVEMANFNSFVDKLDMEFWHEICAKNGKLCHYKKGEYFVQQGDVIRYMGIVKEGYFKYVVTDLKENEHITGLALPGEFIGDYLSTTYKTPCMTSLVASTNAEVLVCNCEVLNKVFDEDRELHQQLSDLLFHDVYKRYLDMHRFSPKERYIDLLKRCPDILQNISIKEIASFLNVTPTYLSCIRKEITFENK